MDDPNKKPEEKEKDVAEEPEEAEEIEELEEDEKDEFDDDLDLGGEGCGCGDSSEDDCCSPKKDDENE